jgi:hypothetical protein
MSDVNNGSDNNLNNGGDNGSDQNSSDVVTEGGNPENNKSAKTFTQEEVNTIVQNRLKKEKDSFNLERDSLSGELDVYKKFVEGYVDEVILRYDIAVGELLKKLSVTDQLDWIQKNKDKLDTKTTYNIPETPSGGDKKTFKPKQSNFRL